MILTWLQSVAVRLGGLSRWRRAAAAFGFGLLSVLALPPVFALPVLLISFPALLWLLGGVTSKRAAFAVGWCFGWGHWVGGVYWIANALLVDAVRFGWMVPFAVGGLAAFLALYVGVVTLGTFVLAKGGVGRVLVFAGLWTVMEAARGVLLTGFSWSPLGSVWMPVLAMIQPAAWIGVYGLSLVTAFVAALPALLGEEGVGRWKPVALGFIGLGILAGAGAARLPEGPSPTVEGVRLRLVQPDIPQAMKWAAEARAENLRRYVALSVQPSADGVPPSHVIWGETAVPFALDGVNDRTLREVLGNVVAPAAERGKDAALLTGIIRMTPEGQPFQLWNSLVAIDAVGTVRAAYDKAHLVPFGEYVPYSDIIPLRKITPGGTDYTAGPGPQTLALPGLPPASPLVCYEVIFPGEVVDPSHRPQWLLNVTNDGWYGLSAGPHQHLASSVLRAVEEGLPLVRAANTGISVVIDAYGREIGRIGLGEEGVLDADLPRALDTPPLFAREGNRIPLGLSILAILFGLLPGVQSLFGKVKKESQEQAISK